MVDYTLVEDQFWGCGGGDATIRQRGGIKKKSRKPFQDDVIDYEKFRRFRRNENNNFFN